MEQNTSSVQWLPIWRSGHPKEVVRSENERWNCSEVIDTYTLCEILRGQRLRKGLEGLVSTTRIRSGGIIGMSRMQLVQNTAATASI